MSPRGSPESVVRTLCADCLGDAAEEFVVGISDGTLLAAAATTFGLFGFRAPAFRADPAARVSAS